METNETCCRHAALSWQQAMNESDQSWPSRDAHTLLRAGVEPRDLATGCLIIERLNKPRQVNPCVRTITDLPEVSCTTQQSTCSHFQNYRTKVYAELQL